MARTAHGLPGIYNSSPFTLASGEGSALSTDANGNIKTASAGGAGSGALATTPLYTQQSFLYSNIPTSTTTVVKTGAGLLHTLVINTRGTGSTVTLYDNTAGSGTKIATIDTTLSTTAFVYDVAFTTGLTAVTAGAGAADVTISYQ